MFLRSFRAAGAAPAVLTAVLYFYFASSIDVLKGRTWLKNTWRETWPTSAAEPAGLLLAESTAVSLYATE